MSGAADPGVEAATLDGGVGPNCTELEGVVLSVVVLRLVFDESSAIGLVRWADSSELL